MFCGCVFSFCSWAQDDPTIVYGAANMGEGKENVFVVEQPQNVPNPLGNPIVGPDKPAEVLGDVDNNFNQQNKFENNDNLGQINQNNLGNDFENTLLEANGRVYDVQSYPKADIKVMENPSDPQTIYSPNVND
jgi:hypothetical protein